MNLFWRWTVFIGGIAAFGIAGLALYAITGAPSAQTPESEYEP